MKPDEPLHAFQIQSEMHAKGSSGFMIISDFLTKQLNAPHWIIQQCKLSSHLFKLNFEIRFLDRLMNCTKKGHYCEIWPFSVKILVVG